MERLLLLLTLFITSSLLKTASADDNNYGLKIKFDADPTEFFSTKVDASAPAFSFGTKSRIGPTKPDAVDCQTNKGETNFGQTIKNFSITLEDIGSASACLGVKEGINDRFSVNNCKLLTECATGKMKKDKSSLAGYFGLPKMMAEDYVNLQLQQNLKDMEKTEALRKFAEKKYGKDFAPICRSIFDYDATTNDKNVCDKSVMDNGFARSQKKCNIVKLSCFNSGFDTSKDYAGFLSSFKPASEDESSFQSFFATKTDNQVNDSLTSDNEMLDALAAIISGNGKTNDKVHDVFAKLFELKKQGKIDPVFDFGDDYISDESSIYKKSSHYKFLAKALTKHMDMAQARDLIEKYRRDFAKENLINTCPSIPSYFDICSVATEVYKSKRAHILDRKGSALIFSNDMDDDRYLEIKNLFPNSVHSKFDYSIVMDANRCKAFDFLDVAEDMSAKVRQMMNPYGDPLGANFTQNFFATNLGQTSYFDNPYSQYAKITRPKDDDVIRTTKPLFTMPDAAISGSKQFVGPPVSAANFDKTIAKGTDDFSASLGAGIKDTAAMMAAPSTGNQAIVNSNYVSSNSFSNYAVNTTEPSTGASTKTVSTTASANALLNDRITALSKKLANSEDSLARIREEKVEAQAAKEHQEKVDEENKTIAGLKEQLNDLKTQTGAKSNNETLVAQKMAAKTKEKSSGGITRSPASESSDEGETHVASTARAVQDNGPQNTAHSAGNYSSGGSESASGTGTHSASGGNISSGSLSSGSGSSAGGSGIVLTKVDSVSDAAIQDKILEFNNGQHFFIQEGEMVQEIVPVMKNGKIILDNDGKPKFTIGNAINKDKKEARALADERKPANNDAADLKRQEEERTRRERAEYLKLKKLTNGILESNN